MHYPDWVKTIIDRLESHGFEAFIVGGSLRDTIMRRVPNDYDVTTSALPNEILSVFSDMRTVETGLKHGTVTVISEGNPIEVTTYRIDGQYLDSRHPEEVFFTDDISADLSRRDFTVNAMAFSEHRGLVDPFGGREDIERRVIRAVGQPELRFSEDALRIMRAYRFAAQLDFTIEDDTLCGAEKLAGGLKRIAAERISAELLKLISAERPSYALTKMREGGVLSEIFGGQVPSKEQILALDGASLSSRAALAVLLYRFEPSERARILASLKLPTRFSSAVTTISKRLSEPFPTDEAGARRLIGSSGELVSDLLCAAKALGIISERSCELVRSNIQKRVCTSISELSVGGKELIALGLRGKDVGETLAYLLDKVIEDPTLNERETLLGIAKNKMRTDNL